MKKEKIIYWMTTTIIVLFDSLVPALTSHTELAKQGISHLGYPDYFRTMIVIYKIVGGLLLVLPFIPRRLKELAYAGFAFNFISASGSHGVVDGPGVQTFFPLVILAILVVSYVCFVRLQQRSLATQMI